MKHKPNLFIVGFPKCGTTSLHDWLKQHPDIFMTADKEPQYFSMDRKSQYLECRNNMSWIKKILTNDKFIMRKIKAYTTEKDYEKLFQDVKNETIIGESSAGYIYYPRTAKAIHKFNPNSKIIILIREPSSRIESRFNHQVKYGHENTNTIEDAMKLESKRLQGKHIPINCVEPSKLQYSNMGYYHEFIKSYIDVFGNHNIKIVLFDDVVQNPISVYQSILTFLEVDTAHTPSFFVSNQSYSIKLPLIKQIFELPIIRYIPKKLLPTRIYNGLKEFFIRLISKPKTRILPETKHMLKQKYKADVAKLDELLHSHQLLDPSVSLTSVRGYDN